MTTSVATTTAAPVKRPGMAKVIWNRFRRQKAALVCLILIIAEIIIAAGAPIFAPYDPLKVDYTITWETPSKEHIFGVDDLGRDVLSRLIYGGRISIAIGIVSQIAALAIGLPLGALAGMLGGWFDFAITRFIEILTSVPTIFLYILMMIALGAGFQNLVLAMAITNWTGIARLVRGQVLSLRQTDYVRAATAMGGDTKHIITTHLMRNALGPVLVAVTFGVPSAMLAEAGLSFLGLGIRPPDTSWGQMVGMYQSYILTSWHLTVFPALVMSVTMFLWYQFGEGLRIALDPSFQI